MGIFSLILIITIAAGYVYINNQIQPIIPLMNQSHNKSNATPDNTKQIITNVNANSKNINNSNMINITSDLTPKQTNNSNSINNSNQNNIGGNGAVNINYSNN
jgi:predicted PurR-regulated permease PerM